MSPDDMGTIEVFYMTCGDVIWIPAGSIGPRKVRCTAHDTRPVWFERRNVWKAT